MSLEIETDIMKNTHGSFLFYRYTVANLMEGRQYKFRLFTETYDGVSQPIEYEPPVFTPRKTGTVICFCSINKYTCL